MGSLYEETDISARTHARLSNGSLGLLTDDGFGQFNITTFNL